MGDVVGHKEYSSEGKIDPFPLDMNAFRRDVQAILDGNSAGGNPVSAEQIGQIHYQVAQPHPVRKVVQRIYYNVKDGQLWSRAGLADIWNEVVWDGYVNPVDILDGKDDPDRLPNSPNAARRGSLISYVLATYRDTALGRRAAEEARENTARILELLEAARAK